MGYQDQQRTVVDWGAAPTTAPSTKRVDALGWIVSSAALGAVCGGVALRATWHGGLGFEAPPGDLWWHVAQSLRWCVHAAMPNWFVNDAQVYQASIAKLNAAQRFALGWRAALGACAAIAPGALIARGALAPSDGLIPLRGAQRFEGGQAAKALRRALASRASKHPDHPIAPGIVYPSDLWARHVLLVAGTGAGKSTMLRPLIERVVKSVDSMLLFDPKGEFTKAFPKPAIMAPWDARSLSWDIAKDLRNVGDMRRFAGAMVREAQDPMWSNAARQLLVGFLIYLKSTRDADWGWRELASMIALPQASVLSIMTAHHPEAIRAVERASVTTQGIMINLASFAAPIFDLAEAWGDMPASRRVSVVEWTHQQGPHRQLILQGHGAYPDLTKSYLEGLFGVVSAIINSVEIDDDPKRKLWIIIDEAPQCGKIPIRPILDVGRSRGARCILACQDLAQLEEIHGQHTAKALASMVGTLVVGQMMQGETAEQLCKAMGTIEVERANISASSGGGAASAKSTTLSFSRDELAVYKPSELGSRLGPTRDGKGVKMAVFTGGSAYELFWPHFAMPSRRPAHMPAKWTRRFDRCQRAQGEGAESRPPERHRAEMSTAGPRDETLFASNPQDSSAPVFSHHDSQANGRLVEHIDDLNPAMPSVEEIESLLRQQAVVTVRSHEESRTTATGGLATEPAGYAWEREVLDVPMDAVESALSGWGNAPENVLPGQPSNVPATWTNAGAAAPHDLHAVALAARIADGLTRRPAGPSQRVDSPQRPPPKTFSERGRGVNSPRPQGG